MRRFYLLGIGLLLLSTMNSCIAIADTPRSSSTVVAHDARYTMPVPFIFIENGVEFAIYPNGEFDFAFVGRNYAHNPYNSAHRNFSYNGGYNYDFYIQFDRYGAVIQVENVPIHYDYYGRITRAGNVRISYRNNYVSQIGMMHVVYNTHYVYDYSYGYINTYNRTYHVQPWHHYYARPVYTVIYHEPYRRSYNPVRYSFEDHRKQYNDNRGRSNQDYNSRANTNMRRTFLEPGTNQPRTLTSETTGRRGESSTTPGRTDTNTSTDRRGDSNATPGRTDTNTSIDRRGNSSSTTNRLGTDTNTSINRRETNKTVRPVENTRKPATTNQPTETRRSQPTDTRGSSNQSSETRKSEPTNSRTTNSTQNTNERQSNTRRGR